MIILPPSPIAVAPPPTNAAVLNRLRVVRCGDRIRILSRSVLQPSTYLAAVCCEILNPKRLDGRTWIRRDHVKHLWNHALSNAKQLRIESELQDRASARLLRKLSIDD